MALGFWKGRNTKTMTKALIDIGMITLLMILMAYHITGNKVHEWIGVFLLLLFMLHHIFNWNWYKSLFKGKYTAMRILHTTVNVLLIAAMLIMMVSGIMLSREVFVFLNISVGWLGRRLHMVSVAWGFLLIAVHLGFHWGMVIRATKKLMKAPEKNSFYFVCASRLAAVIMSVYGIYAFISRQIWQKLFLVIEYAYFDYEESALSFLADYIAIMGLFTCVAYYSAKLIRKMETT